MTTDEIIALLDPPGGASTAPQMCVDVRLATGRYYLNVLGVSVAVEGDLCRDSRIPARVWDKDSLEHAAAVIRKRLAFLIEILH